MMRGRKLRSSSSSWWDQIWVIRVERSSGQTDAKKNVPRADSHTKNCPRDTVLLPTDEIKRCRDLVPGSKYIFRIPTISLKLERKNSNELRLNLKSHQKNSNLWPVSQFMRSPIRVLHAQNTFPVRSQINIFACFSPRINKSNQNECAAGEIFHQNGVIYFIIDVFDVWHGLYIS